MAAVLAIVDLPGTDPFGVFIALPVHGVTAVVGRAAMGAEQLASQKVGVVADALAVLHVLAPSAQYGIGLFP